MRYASLGGGKRLRPFLVVESAALFEVPRENALMAGAALECVHCYSLAHDDLPAMDNDDLRRGRPTAHKAFDEATAILAGDGLLDLRLRHPLPVPRPIPIPRSGSSWCWRWRARRASAAWSAARCSTSRPKAGSMRRRRKLGEQDVKTLQAMKTGALLRFGCLAGAILGKADAASGPRSSATAPRSARRSRSPTICSISKAIRQRSARRPARTPPRTRRRWSACSAPAAARRRLDSLVAEAQAALGPFGSDADVLKAAARFVATRSA